MWLNLINTVGGQLSWRECLCDLILHEHVYNALFLLYMCVCEEQGMYLFISMWPGEMRWLHLWRLGFSCYDESKRLLRKRPLVSICFMIICTQGSFCSDSLHFMLLYKSISLRVVVNILLCDIWHFGFAVAVEFTITVSVVSTWSKIMFSKSESNVCVYQCVQM